MALDSQALAALAALSDDSLVEATDAPGDQTQPDGEDTWPLLRDIVAAEVGLAPDTITEDMRIVEDLDLDVLRRYAVVTALEHETHVSIPDAKVDAAYTLADLARAASAST